MTYQVCWVLGGGSAGNGAKEQYESFTNPKRAEAFRLEVEEAGHRWPAGWVKGQGYVTTPTEPEPPKITLDEVADRYWLACEKRVARGRLKAYTLHRYKRAWAVHIEPSLGGLAYVNITDEDISERIDDQLDAGAAPKSIRNRHGIFYSVVQHGVQREKLRADNPCATTELPEVDRHAARQIRFFTHAEWSTFRNGLKDDVLLLCDYLLATGLRWGEVSALRIGDLSIKDNGDVVAHIVRAWSGRSPDDTDEIDWAAGEAKKWKLGPPKNKRGRYVVVTRDVAHRVRTCIEGRSPDEYLFARAARRPGGTRTSTTSDGGQRTRRRGKLASTSASPRTCSGTHAWCGRSPRASGSSRSARCSATRRSRSPTTCTAGCSTSRTPR